MEESYEVLTDFSLREVSNNTFVVKADGLTKEEAGVAEGRFGFGNIHCLSCTIATDCWLYTFGEDVDPEGEIGFTRECAWMAAYI